MSEPVVAVVEASPEARSLAREMAAAGLEGFDVLCVLGSGLGAFAERLDERRRVPFGELPSMPQSAVPGHAGEFCLGRLGSGRVLVQRGRVHLYEGWSPEAVTRSVRAAALLGARALLLTNAAGGLRKAWKPPTLMRVVDHLNLQHRTPLGPGEVGRGRPYDKEAGELLVRAAEEAGVELKKGVYAGTLGPNYETPAEIRLYDRMGADAVGMSTVAEALAGHASGLRVAAVSCITNPAAGVHKRPLSHAEVLAAGAAGAESFGRLLQQALPLMAGLERTPTGSSA